MFNVKLKKMDKRSMLEKGVVIALVLNYLGVVSKTITMFDLYHGLSVTVKVGKKNYTVDSEKIAFLRSIGINVDVEIVDGRITLEITLPYENQNGWMDVECEDIAKLLCQFFRDVFMLSECEYKTEGFVSRGYLAVTITKIDGDDLRLDFHGIRNLMNFDITPFVRPVKSTKAIVGFIY